MLKGSTARKRLIHSYSGFRQELLAYYLSRAICGGIVGQFLGLGLSPVVQSARRAKTKHAAASRASPEIKNFTIAQARCWANCKILKCYFKNFKVFKTKKGSARGGSRSVMAGRWFIARTAHAIRSRTLLSQTVLTKHLVKPAAFAVANRALSNATEETAQSLSVLQVQAESGNIIAQFNLGQAYLNGHHGLSKSSSDAIFWIKR
jgi:TPR repeat protein